MLVALAQRSAMGQNTVSNVLERQLASGNIQPLSTTNVFRKRASRGGIVPGLAAGFFSATFPQSPAPDDPSFLLGEAAGAAGRNTAAKRRRNDEIPFLWSENRPAEAETLERPQKLWGARFALSALGFPTSGRFGRNCDQGAVVANRIACDIPTSYPSNEEAMKFHATLGASL